MDTGFDELNQRLNDLLVEGSGEAGNRNQQLIDLAVHVDNDADRFGSGLSRDLGDSAQEYRTVQENTEWVVQHEIQKGKNKGNGGYQDTLTETLDVLTNGNEWKTTMDTLNSQYESSLDASSSQDVILANDISREIRREESQGPGFWSLYGEYLAPWNNPPAVDGWDHVLHGGKWVGGAMAVVGSAGAALKAYGVGAVATFLATEVAEAVVEETTGIPVITDPKDVVEALAKRGLKKAGKETLERAGEAAIETAEKGAKEAAEKAAREAREAAEKAAREAREAAAEEASKKTGKKARDSGKNEPHVGKEKVEAARNKIEDLERQIEEFKRTKRGTEGFKKELKKLEDRLKHQRLKETGGREGPHGRRKK